MDTYQTLRAEIDILSRQECAAEFQAYELMNLGRLSEADALMDKAREYGERRDRLKAALEEMGA